MPPEPVPPPASLSNSQLITITLNPNSLMIPLSFYSWPSESFNLFSRCSISETWLIIWFWIIKFLHAVLGRQAQVRMFFWIRLPVERTCFSSYHIRCSWFLVGFLTFLFLYYSSKEPSQIIDCDDHFPELFFPNFQAHLFDYWFDRWVSWRGSHFRQFWSHSFYSGLFGYASQFFLSLVVQCHHF